MLRARTAITGVAVLVLGMASAFTLAQPANAQPAGVTTVINVHYDSCLSELGATAGTLIGLDVPGQPTCNLDTGFPSSQHSEAWTIATPITSSGTVVNCITSKGVNVNCFELVNYHSGLCLTDYELEAEVEPCAPSNGDDLWTTYYNTYGPVNGQNIYQLKNIHYGYCLGAGSTGLGGTGMNTCPGLNGNHAAYWYLPDL